MSVGRRIACLAVTIAAAGPPAAVAQTLSVTADVSVRGHVTLVSAGDHNGTVRFSEIVGGGGATLGEATGPAGAEVRLARAARWLCDRRERRFRAEATTADGQALVAETAATTPACGDRFLLKLKPARPRVGRPLTLVVEDRWRVGDARARVCVASLGRRRCGTAVLAPGDVRSAWRTVLARTGRWRATATVPGARRRSATLHVRRRSGPLRVLATGDSMIQIVDSFLERGLAPSGVTVRSDARISTGITKPFMLNWPNHARTQVRRSRPDATVVFLGANDGFALRTPGGAQAHCCDAAWQAAYARRASRMMRTYARQGAGTVYWLLLPTPRSGTFQKVFRGVNRAILKAARSHPGIVRVVDLRRTFTPGGRFRQTIRWRGRTVSVRQADGVHLNVQGATIAAQLVIRAMRRDGVI